MFVFVVLKILLLLDIDRAEIIGAQAQDASLSDRIKKQAQY